MTAADPHKPPASPDPASTNSTSQGGDEAATQQILAAGVQPGLRFAAVLDQHGGCRDLDWAGVQAWRAETGFLWIHLEMDTPEASQWVRNSSGINPAMVDLLLAEDSRPRVEAVDDGLLLVLRGINLAASEVELVPIHVWIDERRAVTLRDRAHSLNALRDIRLDLVAGRGPCDAGGLLVPICSKIVRDLEPILEQMDLEVTELEEQIIDASPAKIRQKLADLRRRAIHLRRYLVPQREALFHLQTVASGLLSLGHRMSLSTVIDMIIRFIEDLDAIRERCTVVHEDLSALINEQISKTSNRLTAVAALLLTPSLLVGMLGANVGGIPFNNDPYGFQLITSFIVGIVIVQFVVFRRIRWL